MAPKYEKTNLAGNNFASFSQAIPDGETASHTGLLGEEGLILKSLIVLR